MKSSKCIQMTQLNVLYCSLVFHVVLRFYFCHRSHANMREEDFRNWHFVRNLYHVYFWSFFLRQQLYHIRVIVCCWSSITLSRINKLISRYEDGSYFHFFSFIVRHLTVYSSKIQFDFVPINAVIHDRPFLCKTMRTKKFNLRCDGRQQTRDLCVCFVVH